MLRARAPHHKQNCRALSPGQEDAGSQLTCAQCSPSAGAERGLRVGEGPRRSCTACWESEFEHKGDGGGWRLGQQRGLWGPRPGGGGGVSLTVTRCHMVSLRKSACN